MKRQNVSCFFLNAWIEIDSFWKNVDFYTSISWARFEQFSALSHGIIKLVEKSLKDAEFDKSQINKIVLVGGSTCIP